MHYVSQSRPNPVGWLRRALREILFVFLPITIIVLGIATERTPLHNSSQDIFGFWFGLVVVSVLVAPVLWAIYRVIRFAIGK